MSWEGWVGLPLSVPRLGWHVDCRFCMRYADLGWRRGGRCYQWVGMKWKINLHSQHVQVPTNSKGAHDITNTKTSQDLMWVRFFLKKTNANKFYKMQKTHQLMQIKSVFCIVNAHTCPAFCAVLVMNETKLLFCSAIAGHLWKTSNAQNIILWNATIFCNSWNK